MLPLVALNIDCFKPLTITLEYVSGVEFLTRGYAFLKQFN